MARIKLSPPWDIYATEVTQMFKYDSEVHVIYDEENYDLKLYVDNDAKACALGILLPEEKTFGNIKLSITIVPANKNCKSVNFTSNEDLFNAAFNDNPALEFIQTIHGVFPTDITYVVFANQVVQYYTDNLFDYYGVTSTLFQYVARDIFNEIDGVSFCTALPPMQNDISSQWP